MHPIYHRIVNRRNIILFCGVDFVAFAFWYFKDVQALYGKLVDIFAYIAIYRI
jgi:hypothetical protein